MDTSERTANEANEGLHIHVNRRRFLLLSGLAFAASPLLIAGCGAAASSSSTGSSSGTGATSSTAGGGRASGVAAPGSSATGLKLPTYVPIQGATPDLPGTADGVDAGYLTFPKKLFKSVAKTPGQGGDVNVLTRILVAPPPTVDQNPAWQAVNKALNANVKINMVPSTDYQAKFATTVAGGDLPDILHIPSQFAFPGLPQFLQSACQDLTPYLGGDAIKDYPNLANIPTLAWKQTVFNGAIYGVAIPRPFVQTIWYVNQDRLDAVGAGQPKDAADFKRILQALTQPSAGHYGIGGEPSNAIGLLGSPPSVPFPAMFGAPNNWRLDDKGNLMKDVETDEFKAAVGYIRDLYASGVFNPNTPNATTNTNKLDMVAGKFSVYQDGFFSYATEYWDAGKKLTPPVRFRTIHPFSHDGGKPIWFQFNAFFGMATLKKATPDRIRELLRILDYTAAPFGSEEAFLLEYGVKDVDYSLNDSGNPILTKKGQGDTSVSWRYMTMRPQVLFDPNDPDFAKVAQADEKTIIPVLVSDPTLGLYSAANLQKGGVITNAITSGLTDIVLGRSPLSNLDQLVKDWRSGGGDQIRSEYQQALAASK